MSAVLLKYAKRALRNILVEELGSGVPVVWGPHPSIPRPPRPYCRLGILAGPMHDGAEFDEKRVVEAIDDATATIDAVTVGNKYILRANGVPISYTAVGGDTVTDVRDGLLAAINAESLDFLTAVSSGIDSIDLTPSSTGSIIGLRLSPTSETTLVENTSGVDVQQVLGRRVMTVTCDFFADNETKLETGALDLASRAMAKLSTSAACLTMADLRTAIKVSSPLRHLSDIEPGGAVMESRALFEVQLALASCAVEPVTPVESVEVTTDIEGVQNTFTIT